jgi:ABC-type ribose transport system, auxiliary component
MKRHGMLNAPIATVLAHMGHKDTLTIADAGLPIPYGVERIDVAIHKGSPSFLSVVEAVSADMHIEELILAEEIKTLNPTVHQAVLDQCPDILVTYVSHEVFKQLTQETQAVIRTGEVTPYANVIFVSNVNF